VADGLAISNVDLESSAIARTPIWPCTPLPGRRLRRVTSASPPSWTALILLAIHLGRPQRGAGRHIRGSLCQRRHPTPVQMSETWGLVGDLKELARKTQGCARFVLRSGPRKQLPIALRRCAQAQGDLVHPRRGLCCGRDEAPGPSRSSNDGLPVAIHHRDQGQPATTNSAVHLWLKAGTRWSRDAVATKGDTEITKNCQDVLWVPDAPAFATAAAHRVAVADAGLRGWRCVAPGHDVDQPRNLAKSVTVRSKRAYSPTRSTVPFAPSSANHIAGLDELCGRLWRDHGGDTVLTGDDGAMGQRAADLGVNQPRNRGYSRGPNRRR